VADWQVASARYYWGEQVVLNTDAEHELHIKHTLYIVTKVHSYGGTKKTTVQTTKGRPSCT